MHRPHRSGGAGNIGEPHLQSFLSVSVSADRNVVPALPAPAYSAEGGLFALPLTPARAWLCGTGHLGAAGEA